MQRGDRLTIIPILGDAEAEASGRILRFEVPENRQAYDTDLQKFRAKMSSALKEMQASAVAHPGSKTDILESLRLADQEFQDEPKRFRKILVILSDFIQDDNVFNFKNGLQTANRMAAQKFASYIANSYPANLNHVKVYAGLLQSSEYIRLGRSRREAIEEFWLMYLLKCGAQPQFVIDGLGLLKNPYFSR